MIKFLINTIYILMFLPMFVFFIIPNSNLYFPMWIIPYIILIFFVSIKNYKGFLVFIKRNITLRCNRYWLFFLFTLVSLIIYHLTFQHYGASFVTLLLIFYKSFLPIILIYTFTTLAISYGFSLKEMKKKFYIMIGIITILGIIQFISMKLNLNILNYTFLFFTNLRKYLYEDSIGIYEQIRAASIYGEPSGLGQFIVIVLPFAINLFNAKDKIFRNNWLNTIYKKGLLPCLLLALIMTKSPIYLVFCIVELLIFFILYNYKNLKRMLLFVFIFIICFALITCILEIENIDIKHTYLKRIFIVVDYFKEFSVLAYKEQSLATRLHSYSMQLIAFTKHIFVGCGFGNAQYFIAPFYVKEAILPLTIENYQLQFLRAPHGFVHLNFSTVYTMLAELGLIGFCAYLLFIIKYYLYSKFISKHFFENKDTFYKSVQQSMIAIVILYFYNLYFTSGLLWLIYGFIPAYFYYYKYIKKGVLIKCTKKSDLL